MFAGFAAVRLVPKAPRSLKAKLLLVQRLGDEELTRMAILIGGKARIVIDNGLTAILLATS